MDEFNKHFCVTAWRLCYGISKASFYRYKREAIDPTYESSRTMRVRPVTDGKADTLSFLKEYFAIFAEPLPDDDRKHLINIKIRSELYEQYRRHQAVHDLKVFSEVSLMT
jgi:hypothetical protein